MRRKVVTRVETEEGAVGTSVVCYLLRAGAALTTGGATSVPANSTATVRVRHPGALKLNDRVYWLATNGVTSGSFQINAAPTYNSGGYWEIVLLDLSGSTTAIGTTGDLVLQWAESGHWVTWYDTDTGGSGTSGVISPSATTGALSFYVDVPDLDVAIVSGGALSAYFRDLPVETRKAVTPQEFGAVADGSNDDTAAIQAAVNFVSLQGGGTVYFPEGSYKVTSTITVAETGVKLVGENWYKSEIVFSMGTPGSDGIKVYNASKRLDSCSIENLRLEGTTSDDGLGHMIHLDGTRLCTIRHCNLFFSRAYDDGAAAIYIDATGVGNSSINRIESCEITVPSFKAGGARSIGYGIYFASTAGTKLNNGNQVSNVVIYGPASADDCPAIQIGSGTLYEQNACSGHFFSNVRMDSSEGGGVVINTNSNRFSNLIIDGPSADTLLTIGQYGSRSFFMGYSNNGQVSVSGSLANGRQPFYFGPGLYEGPTIPTFVLDPRTDPPPSGVKGGLYYDSDTDLVYYNNGSSWVAFATASAYLPLAGGTMTGNIDLGGNRISEMAVTVESVAGAAATTVNANTGFLVITGTGTAISTISGCAAGKVLKVMFSNVTPNTLAATGTPADNEILTALSPTQYRVYTLVGWNDGTHNRWVVSN